MTTTPEMAASPHELGTGDGILVTPQWLAARVSDPQVRVVEVDVSAAAYRDWHIDGAVLWNIYADLKDADYHLRDSDALQRLIERSGIGPDSTVVFYGYAPALGMWLLKLYGHGDARILDCSRETWRAAGRPCSTAGGESAPEAASAAIGYHLGSTNPRIRADQAAVHAAIGNPHCTVLDVRTLAEYRGERFWPSGAMEPCGRAGHVPAAVHQPLDGLYREDGSFRPAAELCQVFSSADLDTAGELITYCTIGGRAATAWFVLTYLLGRESVRVYDGSWAEWGRTPGSPVECP